MKINQILRTRRRELGISQSELAQWCGFAGRGQICHLEQGRRNWKFRDVEKAAELLKLEIEIRSN